jgi:hypothetical protein
MPDWRDNSVWRRLAAEPGLQMAAAQIDSRDAASITRLRRGFDADIVSAALELAEARRKALGKLDGAERLWCDVAGVEQASDARVAAWKAARFREVLGAGAEVLDVCCGVGGDAIALAASGLRVTAVDLDERRAWMAARNAECESRVADAESLALTGVALHADPARREERGGQRSWSIDDHRPGRAWIERALREARAAAIKFSPGVDRRAFGDAKIAWEFVESDGRLVQALAWAGAFAPNAGETRATLVARTAAPASVVGTPDDCRSDRIGVDPRLGPGRWICEPTAALERAQLLTHATRGSSAREIARSLGLLVADEPLAAPWFESFAIVADCAPRSDAVREQAARHGVALRSVRVRGQAVDADRWTRELACRPEGDGVVFVWRDGSGARAVIARVTSSLAS